MSTSDLLAAALTLFLIANPIGNMPVITSVIKEYSFEEQKRIVLREATFALLLSFFFQFFGEVFLRLLNISASSVSICGGSLLLFVSINMIFANPTKEAATLNKRSKPFIVPIATPIIAGPGLLTMIMIFSGEFTSSLMLSSAIFLSWLGVLAVMVSAPYLQRLLKKRGLLAVEQLMGMLVTLMSMDMLLNGIALFIKGK